MKRRFLPLLLSLALVLPLCPAALATEDTPAQTIYVTTPGEAVHLNAEDFQHLCRQQTGHELASVTFDALPRETGDLWFRRDRSTGWKVSVSSICDAKTLDDITYLPSKDFLGQAEVGFTLMSEKRETVSGTLFLLVSAPTTVHIAPPNQSTSGDISRRASIGTVLSLDLAPREGNCTVSLPPSSLGTFWVNYEDKDLARKLLAGEQLVSLDGSLTFVPAGDLEGTLLIDLPGRDKKGNPTLRVLSLTYNPLKQAETVRYSTRTDPVYLREWDFYRACGAREAGSLISLRFDTLPDPTRGTLTYSGTAVTTGREYDYSLLSGLCFTPGPSFGEAVTLSYTGTDSNGVTFPGTLEFSWGAYRSTRFSDLDSWAWAAPAADRLAQALGNGASGGQFRPDENATRLDTIRALTDLNYGSADPGRKMDSPFADLPTDSPDRAAVNVAYAHGLVQGDEAGRLNPNTSITRQDVMVLCYRIMEEKGMPLPAPADLSVFADADQAAPYAKDALSVLVAAGIVKGTGDGRLAPTAPITRAEMATLICLAFPA